MLIKTDSLGVPRFTNKDLIDMIYQGNADKCHVVLCDPSDEVDKFNAAMEKLQRIVGDLLAGPLGSFLDLLSGALNIINYMATPLKYIGGLFLGIYGTMMAINGIGKAIAVTEGLSASLMGRKAGYQAASLTSKIAENTATTFGNAQAAISLATEGEKLSFKTLGSALEKESLLTRTFAYGYALKEMIVERGKALLSKMGLISKTRG